MGVCTAGHSHHLGIRSSQLVSTDVLHPNTGVQLHKEQGNTPTYCCHTSRSPYQEDLCLCPGLISAWLKMCLFSSRWGWKHLCFTKPTEKYRIPVFKIYIYFKPLPSLQHHPIFCCWCSCAKKACAGGADWVATLPPLAHPSPPPFCTSSLPWQALCLPWQCVEQLQPPHQRNCTVLEGHSQWP